MNMGSDSIERVAKRLRSTISNGNDDCVLGITLPPEIWARVMEYAPFQTILSCAATHRSMLHDSMPLLKKLHIDRSSELNLAVASRFRDIREIHINSLLSLRVEGAGTPEEWTAIDLDFETKMRVVPFLSRFGMLERVFFGAKDEAGQEVENFAAVHEYFWDGEDAYPNEGARESMLQFIDSISIGYRCKALSKHLKISGLCCPDAANRPGHQPQHHQCQICVRACKSFPLESVLCFERGGSSSSNARSGRSYDLDVCLERAVIESIIESRPGGSELLRSEQRVLHLLASARRYEIVAGGGKALYMVKYKKAEIFEIQRAIADLDVKKLSSRKVSDAIIRSFARGESDPMPPPKYQRYLSKESLDHLTDAVGLGIVREEFERPLIDMVEHAQQIASVLICGSELTASDDVDANGEYDDIELECLRLVRSFVEEIESNPPIHQISGSIHILAEYLARDGEFVVEAISCLKSIFSRGTDEHRKMVIEAGTIPSFSQLLYSSKDCIVRNAVATLSIIVADRKKHIDEVAKAGAITGLIRLLDSNHGDCVVNNSLMVLAAAKDHIEITARANSLFPHLVRIIMSSDAGMLAKCSVLLRKILDVGFPIQKVVADSAFVSRLVEITKTTNDQVVQNNLTHAMMKLASGSNEETAILVEAAGFVSFLVSLQDSPCDTIAQKAISAVNNIASCDQAACVSWKQQATLSWGEFLVGELVDGDEESDFSFEEAEEIDDEQVELEEKQAMADNNSVNNDKIVIDFDRLGDNAEESPTIMGIPNNLLEKILCLLCVSEVVLLEGVSKKFRRISGSDDFWARYPTCSTNSRKLALQWHGSSQIQKWQMTSSTENLILGVLSDETDEAENIRNISADLLARMIRLNPGPEVHFRLRGDTIWYLTELAQGNMIEKLRRAFLVAVHSHRIEVQREDISLVFQKVRSCYFFQEDSPPRCNGCVESPCMLSSEILWHWPDDD